MKLFLGHFLLRLVTDVKRELYGFVFETARAPLNKYSNQPVLQLSHLCELGMCRFDKGNE